MDEAAELCDRVLMMDNGHVLADGTPEQLCREHGCSTLEEVFMQLTGKTLEAEPEEVEV
jgi:ABC-type Na+ transport system ATPase subunit NatA